MTPNDDEWFQDRVDELLLLEQRADRRAERLLEITRHAQESSQTVLKDLSNGLAQMNVAVGRMKEYRILCARQASRATHLFLGAVAVAVFIVAGTLGWVHSIHSRLADTKAQLVSLDRKLKHTPVILSIHGKDYVRVVPDSEVFFTRRDGRKMPGRYSEVWHGR